MCACNRVYVRKCQDGNDKDKGWGLEDKGYIFVIILHPFFHPSHLSHPDFSPARISGSYLSCFVYAQRELLLI
jgi:hypothetical protein